MGRRAFRLAVSDLESGGRGGIRTPDGLAPMPVFKTGAFNHSATRPLESEDNLNGQRSAAYNDFKQGSSPSLRLFC